MLSVLHYRSTSDVARGGRKVVAVPFCVCGKSILVRKNRTFLGALALQTSFHNLVSGVPSSIRNRSADAVEYTSSLASLHRILSSPAYSVASGCLDTSYLLLDPQRQQSIQGIKISCSLTPNISHCEPNIRNMHKRHSASKLACP